jgi:hypothetical protein
MQAATPAVVFLDSADRTHSPSYGSSVVTDVGGSIVLISAYGGGSGDVYVVGRIAVEQSR